MSNEKQAAVATKPEEGALVLPAGVGMTPEQIQEKSKGEGFVPWLSLAQASSNMVKEEQIKGIRAGDYYLGGRLLVCAGDKPHDNLSSELKVKAVTIMTKGKDGKPTVVFMSRDHATSSDPELESFTDGDAVWKQIEQEKRARNQDNRCYIGVDWLVWLPEWKTIAVFSFANTARQEMPDMAKIAATGGLALFRSRLVKNKGNSWHVPSITASAEKCDLPAKDMIDEAIKYFVAPVIAYQSQKPAAANPTSRPR
jgi:hypothetical protein